MSKTKQNKNKNPVSLQLLSFCSSIVNIYFYLNRNLGSQILNTTKRNTDGKYGRHMKRLQVLNNDAGWEGGGKIKPPGALEAGG